MIKSITGRNIIAIVTAVVVAMTMVFAFQTVNAASKPAKPKKCEGFVMMYDSAKSGFSVGGYCKPVSGAKSYQMEYKGYGKNNKYYHGYINAGSQQYQILFVAKLIQKNSRTHKGFKVRFRSFSKKGQKGTSSGWTNWINAYDKWST